MFWVHSLCPGGFGLPPLRRQIRRLTVLIENRADTTGADMTGGSLALAGALTKVGKHLASPRTALVPSLTGNDSPSVSRQRVMLLLGEGRPLRRPVLGLALLFSALLAGRAGLFPGMACLIFRVLIFVFGGILAFFCPATAANRLAASSSPYLLPHARNPVNWYPWGEEAFARARAEGKPLLSIGYSTCYWCHVMEREIFENPEIAGLMNESIVSVKIDRKQRPDLDEIYMKATQLATGRGGWPNNVFVTPDLKPFFCGHPLSPGHLYRSDSKDPGRLDAGAGSDRNGRGAAHRCDHSDART